VTKPPLPRPQKAEVVREYGPFPEVEKVGGVTFDGQRAWLAAGTHLLAIEPETGEQVRRIDVAADAGTAFDGRHLYQITGDVIQKVDATSGRMVGTIPAPGRGGDSGMTWAEGSLWVGHYRERKIYCIAPESGEILRTIESDRFVTGVSWVDGELWHATWEDDASELRRVQPETGEVLERLELPAGVLVSGLESDGADLFYCGGASTAKLRAVRRPRGRSS
jgi:glutamine cyclotransferase